ncbi:hypothetical protein ACIA8C_07455 [Nocardia sp. NPDC051321]|uniref:hypothetical protein n=1 Tax=Nocardia sp. NPDC051321 TaxID=3364323 RepID=UPI0037927D0E
MPNKHRAKSSCDSGTGIPCGTASNETPTALPTQLRNQSITWHDCRTGPDDELRTRLASADPRCGEFQVPLNYADPTGPAITIAVARRAATDTAHRLGTLLVQTGGPGRPGMG